jgi:hypothetical protein
MGRRIGASSRVIGEWHIRGDAHLMAAPSDIVAHPGINPKAGQQQIANRSVHWV